MTLTKPSADPWTRGVYLVPDAARIMRLPVAVLRSWVSGRMGGERRHFPVGEFATKGTGADRHFSRGRQHPIVVDPRRAFGRPVIDGTNLTTEAIMSRLRGGEAVENIAESFRVAPAAIMAANMFEQQKAA
ncbi:MAG: DUF433 domain-containing protein [Akkermansiaceae bacterium]|nr:DUF433 domain-containing protein [Akkermansiaceae bacterium]MCF7730890.1 DUF433 domain-containing protein [Akkermansiaceae bacterium]